MTTWCLVTDIDGTLIGETETSLNLREGVLAERARLERAGHCLRWVIATGRSLDSSYEVLLDQGFALGDFDAFVTSVGAELHFAGEAAPDPHYHARLASSGFDATSVRAVLADVGFLRPQPEDEQRTHKVSYLMRDTPERRSRVHAALARLPFPTATVFSHDDYLDIAPSNGTKGGAVIHLQEYWGLSPERVVAAGDSGNDHSMLSREWHGIVVGNGGMQLHELRSRQNVYFARGKYAAGVLEGLYALGFLTEVNDTV